MRESLFAKGEGMSKYRILSTKNKYSLPKEEYLTAIHYSLRYPLWVEELKTAADTGRAIRYDKDKVQSSNDYDQTAEVAMRMVEISSKISLVDDTIHTVAKGMDAFLRMGVCYGLTFPQLKTRGIPCEKKCYYEMRQKYYYLLAQKI
jgi:hypothetical protein